VDRARTRIAAVLAAAALLAACSSPTGPADPAQSTSGAAPEPPSPTASGPTAQQRVAELLAPGPYVTRTTEYDLEPVRLLASGRPVEVVAQVVGPVDAEGPLPVVMLLHGYWPSCYEGKNATTDWPCPSGYEPIPSYRGYTYLQERLASHGYVTVSVSANAVNVQFGDVGRDGGARARSALLRHHLDLLAAGEVPALADWPGADLGRVLLLGHSRGGEGVDRAAFEQPADAAWDIAGVVLVGATAFDPPSESRAAVVGMTGDCDGDVGPGLGQLYVDRKPADPAVLRSSVLIRGANHNYFSTEWDPATSESGTGYDDIVSEGGTSDPLCEPDSPTRLTAAEQQEQLARGTTLVAAAVLTGDRAAADVLDAREPLPVPDGQKVWVTGTGSGRTTLLPGPGFATTAISPTTARQCVGRSSETPRPRLCGSETVQGISVHWPDRGSTWAANDAVEVAWTASGGGARLALTQPWDISSAYALELRVPIDAAGSPVSLDVAITDSAGQSAVLGSWGPVEALPGGTQLPSRRWAQPLQLPLAGIEGVDLTSITSVTVTPTSPSGRVWLLDLSALPA